MPWAKSSMSVTELPDLKKGTRSVIPSFHVSPEPKIRVPRWNYPVIYELFETSWVLSTISRVLRQECVRPGWSRQPRFVVKCSRCETEFQESVDKCSVCGGEVYGPSLAQARVFDRIVNQPNSNGDCFGDLIKSIVYHDTVADDWYVNILPVLSERDGKSVLEPAELAVEDSRYWMPIADEFGRLGINEWFCPVCYKGDVTSPNAGKCPKCGQLLERTDYVQKISSDITARSSAYWMIHGSTDRVLPNLHGKPKVIGVWDLVHAVKSMDEYIFDAFSEGKLGGILNFPGYNQDQIDALRSRIESDVKKLEVEDVRGLLRSKKGTRTLMIGSDQPIQSVGGLPSLADMESLGHYMLFIQAICGCFGVQPLFISLTTGARGSVVPFMALEVQDRTIKEIHRDKEDVFNSQLFPRFGVTDWMFKFNDVARKDALRDAQILQVKANTLAVLRAEGFEAYIDEHDNLKVPRKATLEPRETHYRGKGKQVQQPKVSGASERVIEGTTTERFPLGPRGEPE